jgi:hypothetical protein
MSTPTILGRIRSALGRQSPSNNPLPLQYTPFDPKHFKDDAGLHFFNLQWQKVINQINASNGATGQVVLPHGLDVRGATVSGLGAPKAESDAISSGHAQQQFSAPVLQPKFDIGGTNQLKGLGYVYQKTQQNAAAVASIPTTYTGGGFINLFGALLQFGLIASMDTAVFPMNFPDPFPNACQAILCATTGPNDRITYVTSFSATQFTLANNGAGAGASWVAIGY